MKVQDIDKVIENLIKNNQLSAILLDGQWGIGKTYTVMEYLKTRTDCKVGYTSLFGKNNIDEINTELYRKLHPKQKVLETISHVVSLVATSVSIGRVGISLNGTQVGQNKTIKTTQKYKTLIVIDDFERKNEKLDIISLMGYFNALTLQGIKIIVLSNFGKTLAKSLGEYREKVFDRIYTLSETQMDVARKLVESEVELEENHLRLAEHNLRMIIKANALYTQTKKYIAENFEKTALSKNLFTYSLYVVIEKLTNKFTTAFLEPKEEGFSKEYYREKMDETQVLAIGKSYENEFGGLFDDSSLLRALFDIFEREDYKTLHDLFAKKEDDIFSKSVFYFSDEKKLEVIKKQYEFILSASCDEKNRGLLELLRGWYDYSGYLDLSFIDENSLFEKLYSLGMNRMDGWHYDGAMKKLLQRYAKFLDKKEEERIHIVLTPTSFNKEDLKQIASQYYGYSKELQSLVKRRFIENNFFIANINGNIDEEKWDLAHLICHFISSSTPELKPQITEWFEKYKKMYPTDLSLKNRLESLVKQYHFELNTMNEQVS